jgi:hypothetical protein
MGLFLAQMLPMIQDALQYPGVQLTAAEKQQVLEYCRSITARKILQRAWRRRQVKEALTFYKSLQLSCADLWHAIVGTHWSGYAFSVEVDRGGFSDTPE